MAPGILSRVDAPRIGRSLRVLRHRRSFRQVDVATAACVSRGRVSLVENGGANAVSVGELRAMFEALDASIDVVVRWRDEGMDRLLDSAHASLVESTVRLLESAGWETAVEASFNIRGERGSIDILAWCPSRRIVLVVEVKTIITDLQAMLQTLDRKVRLAPGIAGERGWTPTVVGRLLVVAEGRTTRRRIAEHGATLGRTFPTRGRAARAWLRHPADDVFGGLILLPVEPAKRVGRRRVRRADQTPDDSSVILAPPPTDGFDLPMAPWTERSEIHAPSAFRTRRAPAVHPPGATASARGVGSPPDASRPPRPPRPPRDRHMPPG